MATSILIRKPKKTKLTYDAHQLELERPQFLKQHSKKRHIPYTQMTAINLITAPNAALATLRLALPDDETLDVTFKTDQLRAVQKMVAFIQKQLQTQQQGEEAQFVKNANLIMDYLKMRNQGILTPTEFEEKKRQILERSADEEADQ
ncbi:hypothetical protein IV38_GL000663 [Lactobacillus selangorensis]|uniref:SHOCT domain-containing protein n=1 Tax=Lactobacillus selangorensis TaxID=81857 RepID=A0A0R2FXT3_9LACO|nr:hypothetical protein [Lactobacillus selangorensis]KRN29773.1 hypothetical protein IV38_GL000663 [Lactobacillus selangorensis]KRN33698.1 hypothetical protein IV40_GL000005 [Lactobacillus selangorensis]